MDARPPTPDRLPELDLARGLAVVFMMTVHALEEWGSLATRAAPTGSVIEFFGSAPAAPVFVFLMGASMAFSKRSGLTAAFRRGAALLGLGIALNVVRGAAPALIGLRLGVVTPQQLAPYTPATLAVIVDILWFAGPAYFLLALVRRALPGRPWAWIAMAAIVVAVSPWLWGRASGWVALDAVVRSLWGTGFLVFFPVFPWLGYALLGLAWGTWLAVTPDRRRFFRRSAMAGLLLLSAGTPAVAAQPTILLGHHWRVGPGPFAWIAGFVLVWLAACHLLPESLAGRWPFRLLTRWSRHVTAIYVVQWLVVAWGTGLVGHQVLGPGAVVLAAPLVWILAGLGLEGWLRLRGT